MTEKKVLINLLIILVLDLLAFTCILPLFPALMDYYGSQSKKNDLYDIITKQLQNFQQWFGIPEVHRFNSVLFGGFLGSLFSLLQFLSAPFLGACSDIYGRKYLMLISACGSAMSYVLWSQARTFEMFVLSRIVGGLCKASVSVASAIVADVLPTKSRGKGMALIGAAFSVGFIVGPMIGAYFARQHTHAAASKFYVTPAYFAVGLSLMELIWIILFLPETLPPAKRIPKHLTTILKNVSTYVSPKALFMFEPLSNNTNANLQMIRRLGLIYFLYLFIYSGLEFTLTFFTHIRFEYNSMQQGQMYLLTGLLMVVFQGGYVRRISAAKQKQTALLGILAIVPAFILIGLSYERWMFYLGLILYAFGSATVVTCLTTAVSSYGAESEQGTILGVFRSLGALARASGPCLASAIFWLTGPTVCYVVGGICLLSPYFLLKKIAAVEHNAET